MVGSTIPVQGIHQFPLHFLSGTWLLLSTNKVLMYCLYASQVYTVCLCCCFILSLPPLSPCPYLQVSSQLSCVCLQRWWQRPGRQLLRQRGTRAMVALSQWRPKPGQPPIHWAPNWCRQLGTHCWMQTLSGSRVHSQLCFYDCVCVFGMQNVSESSEKRLPCRAGHYQRFTESVK